MASLAEQDYPNLSILVIDAASSTEIKGRVGGAAPGAFVRRIDENVGYGAAANEVLEVVEGAAFYLLCHDAVALAPDRSEEHTSELQSRMRNATAVACLKKKK